MKYIPKTSIDEEIRWLF